MSKSKIIIVMLIILIIIGIAYFPLMKELKLKKSLLGYWRLQNQINENEDTMTSYLFYDYNKVQYKYSILSINEGKTTLDMAKGTYTIDKQNKKIKLKLDEDIKELDFIINKNNEIELVSNTSSNYMFIDMNTIKALPNYGSWF